MTLFEYSLHYMTQLCEGKMRPPEGISLTAPDEAGRAAELQGQLATLGIPAFVRLCAEAQGVELPQDLYDEFDPQQLVAALHAAQEAPQEEPPEPQEAPPEPEQKQNAYEAFIDCMLLDDKLLDYLIEVLKTHDGLAFFKLAQVSVRKELTLEDFLYWLGTKELYAQEDERACVTVMDACLSRFAEQGQGQVVAALLSGDQTTFELVRCDAPELRQLPCATYDWYQTYYLDRYYPVRFLMKYRGVEFPEMKLEDNR